MDKVNIKTNHRYQPLLFWHCLTKTEKKSFDWIKEGTEDEYEFFRHHGQCYCISELMVCRDIEPLKGWDGYCNDTFFSGIVVRFSDCGDMVKVGTFIS